MAGKTRSFARTATLRTLLLDRPEGASTEGLLTVGRFDCTQEQLDYTLHAMCATGQLCETTKAGARLWLLSDRTRRLMLAPDAVIPRTRSMDELDLPPSRSISTHATSIRHKEAERQELAAAVARFRSQGGEIQVMENTPLRPDQSRRQINDAAAIFRSPDFCKATF